MPTYKNKKTGELKVFRRTRTYINNDGSKYEIDVESGENLTADWEYVSPEGNYESVVTKKSPTDGYGIR